MAVNEKAVARFLLALAAATLPALALANPPLTNVRVDLVGVGTKSYVSLANHGPNYCSVGFRVDYFDDERKRWKLKRRTVHPLLIPPGGGYSEELYMYDAVDWRAYRVYERCYREMPVDMGTLRQVSTKAGAGR